MQPRVTGLWCVSQADPKGCGVACVASVLRKTYAQVRRRALRDGHWRENYGMNGGMLQRLLEGYRRPVQAVVMAGPVYHLFGQLNFTPGGTAIVKVLGEVPCVVWRNGKSEKRKRLWQHWVVWRDGVVWDPGEGTLWEGTGGAVDGMRLYMAAARLHGKVRNVRTGRWHWV